VDSEGKAKGCDREAIPLKQFFRIAFSIDEKTIIG
jgi:hypothetical protein